MKLTTFILTTVLTGVVCDDRAMLNSVFREIFLNSTAEICPTCSQKNLALETILSEGEIKKYRIELIKKAILDNLGLEEPPLIKPQHWPKPFRSGAYFDDRSIRPNQQNLIDKLVLMPQGMTCEVEDLFDREELALKMKFILPESIDPIDINSVKIWLDFGQNLKDKTFINKEPRAFNMEVIPCANQTNEHTTTFRGFQSFNGDWIEFDAMPVLRSWFERRLMCFNISLSMKSWSINYCRTIQIPEHKPFLTAHYKTNAEVNVPRMKRSRNCTKSSSECCKENLYVSFSDIGWDKWIIFPQGYEAYYCKGSCSGPSALTLSATAHNSVIQGLLHVNKDVSSCCAPTRMLPMDFFVQFNNSSATLTTIPDIVIDTCGCM